MAIVGGVFSRKDGFTGVNDLWGAFAFHAVCMGLGAALLAWAHSRRPAVKASDEKAK